MLLNEDDILLSRKLKYIHILKKNDGDTFIVRIKVHVLVKKITIEFL